MGSEGVVLNIYLLQVRQKFPSYCYYYLVVVVVVVVVVVTVVVVDIGTVKGVGV